ncbi:hypothetical protein GOV03_00145 [Candidatus Woesearchaeota archaeon]|nr:hypothetical protein [Candidatus Woesearchaeota archaeon]
MNHKIRSCLFVLLFVGAMAVVVLFSGFNEEMTGSIVVNSIACYENQDCDDRMEQTEDICRNPGTEYSLCVNKPLRS